MLTEKTLRFHTAKILLIVGGIILAVECVVVLGGFAYLFYDVNGDDLIVELEEYLEANPL